MSPAAQGGESRAGSAPSGIPFDLSAGELLAERRRQLAGWGIPRSTIERAAAGIRSMWEEGPGGWAHEWIRAAEAARRRNRLLEAALCYGAAKFPCPVTPLMREAYALQLDCLVRAAPRFPCGFERRCLMVPYRTERIPAWTHLYWPGRAHPPKAALPILCLSGGVDTWKVELHRLAVLLARIGRFLVAVIDMPGTGESTVALAPDADDVYEGVLRGLREERGGTPRCGVWGISFGGAWAAKLALRGAVDAAVDNGGPIGVEPLDWAQLPNGMTGIVANAMRLPRVPDAGEAARIFAEFAPAIGGQLGTASGTRLLAVNGTADPYVPLADTLVFRDRPGAEVWLVEGADHCAASRLPRVVPAIIAWLRHELNGPSLSSRVLLSLARASMPRLREMG